MKVRRMVNVCGKHNVLRVYRVLIVYDINVQIPGYY